MWYSYTQVWNVFASFVLLVRGFNKETYILKKLKKEESRPLAIAKQIDADPKQGEREKKKSQL